MGYAEYLRELLAPLGVYALGEGTLSGGELEALGAALDDAWEELVHRQAESLPMSAQEEGLEKVAALFPFSVMGDTVEERRQALSGFLQISGDSFTPTAVERCLHACGARCQVKETGTPGTLKVVFPDYMGYPPQWEEKRRIVESILPCHLEPIFVERWNTWKHTARLGMTWEDLTQYSFYDWRMIDPEDDV